MFGIGLVLQSLERRRQQRLRILMDQLQAMRRVAARIESELSELDLLNRALTFGELESQRENELARIATREQIHALASRIGEMGGSVLESVT